MRTRSLIAVVTVSLGTVGAMGQVVPPAPAKTPPSPEFTPPPPPPVKPPIATPKENGHAAQPAPEAPLPTLIERDEAGKIKPLGMPAEEAAVRALKLDEETMKKVESSLAARRDDLDRLVVQNIGALVDLRKTADHVSDKTGVDELQAAGKKATPFRTFVSVADKLTRDGAIDMQTKSKVTRVARDYTKEYEEEMVKGVDHGNYQAMIPLAFKRFMHATCSEAFSSMDRQLAAAAPRMEDLLRGVQMPDQMREAVASKLSGLPKAGTKDADARRLESLKGIFIDVLGPEQEAAFLKAASPKLFEGTATEGEKRK